MAVFHGPLRRESGAPLLPEALSVARGARRALAALAVLASALGRAPAASAQVPGATLRAEFWADREPVSNAGDPWPITPEIARQRILDEAAWVYSGVVYGFDYEYTPYDKARGLEERFSLEALGSIRPEALTLKPGAKARSDYDIRVYVEFVPDEGQASLMESYRRDPWKGSQGIGKADILRGIAGRDEAYRDALRAAVRAYLQGLEPNKPREARGQVAFERIPTLNVSGGYYVVQARVRVASREVLPYLMY
jgi:hypothetical protein